METESKIALFFAGTGALAGFFSGLAVKVEYAFLIALFLFYVSYRLTPRVLNLTPEQTQIGSRKILTTGLGSYFIIWLVFWIMVLNTLLL